MNGQEIILCQGRLAALSFGDEAAPAWLALHGWLDNAATFSRLAPVLSAALNIRLIALDLPGHGHSAVRGEDADYPLWGYLPDVLAALDELNMASATIVGHSMGAGVASLLAAAEPERVQRLILIDGLASSTSEAADTVVQLQAALRAHRRPRSRGRGYESVEAAVEARVRGGVTRLDADTARPIVERNLILAADGCHYWRTDRRLTAPSMVRWTPEQMLATVSTITAPTLLLQASAGVLNERPHFHEACRRIERLTRRVLCGGHHLHLERARVAQVAEEVVRWHQTTNTETTP